MPKVWFCLARLLQGGMVWHAEFILWGLSASRRNVTITTMRSDLKVGALVV